MKTKISLSIIGAFNLIQSTAMLLFADKILTKMKIINPDGLSNADCAENVFRICEVMHYGLAPALLYNFIVSCCFFIASFLYFSLSSVISGLITFILA